MVLILRMLGLSGCFFIAKYYIISKRETILSFLFVKGAILYILFNYDADYNLIPISEDEFNNGTYYDDNTSVYLFHICFLGKFWKIIFLSYCESTKQHPSRIRHSHTIYLQHVIFAVSQNLYRLNNFGGWLF